MPRFLRRVPESDDRGRGGHRPPGPRDIVPILLLALGLCGAGAPPPAAESLPVPPPLPPQWRDVQKSSPAPVPNRDLSGLADDAGNGQTHAHMSLKMAPPSGHPPGEGYVNGSAADYGPNRHSQLSPGISLKVPLQ